uniref:Ribonuclease P protein subunit p29 n=1 Tax=Mesocestoides corti TaxID=53468 RepID=A0A5K3FEV7_MESCO
MAKSARGFCSTEHCFPFTSRALIRQLLTMRCYSEYFSLSGFTGFFCGESTAQGFRKFEICYCVLVSSALFCRSTMYSSYVLTFVRERIPPQRRQQAIVNLDGVGAANYVSLAPLPRADKKTKRRKRHRKVQLLPQFRGQSSKQLKRVMRQQQHPDVRRLTCPSDLPRRLHDLWNQYANSLIDLTKSAQSDEANITHQLENILRMDLIGARLRVLRSITTKQVDLEGIVVMETRNIFYLAREEVVDGKDAEETWLHIVPKRGTVFLLLMTRAEIVLNGNSLAYRPADRAVRKWKLNPSAGAKQKKRPLYTDLFRDYLFTSTEAHHSQAG